MLKNLSHEKSVIGQFNNNAAVVDSCIVPGKSSFDDERLILCNIDKDNGGLKIFYRGCKFLERTTIDLSESEESLAQVLLKEGLSIITSSRSVEKIVPFLDFHGNLNVALAWSDFTVAFGASDGSEDVSKLLEHISSFQKKTILLTALDTFHLVQILETGIVLYENDSSFVGK